ncbi:MAG TPA: DNA-directed RNA polymerase subunit beta' [Planctomycetes bacterium]|nr:DNA-directed RNA polymerase subunit beta' [Planctomycetota bacterium]HIN79806.1 DNA-directed RNA polymerase subunit beta' [Planctomycetota bacterium]
MIEPAYEKINDYGAVNIRLASPTDILSWSYGEVRKPETINYRTYKPEKDGLFCERIFGPEKDWECACGKYKGIKHKGIICDRCGIRISHSRVRRSRMGHINLAAPVVHIWFFKAMPSRLGNLLDMKTTHLERVIYYQDYLVIDPGDTPLKKRQLLSEEEFRFAREKYGDTFVADMGAEAVREMIRRMNLRELSEELQQEHDAARSKQKRANLIRRMRIIRTILDSGNKAEWMIHDAVPVIPPDLRPLVLLESGNFATSDLNDLYRRLINRNNRLKKLLDLNAPEVIIRNEKRMLQHSVDALFDNNRCRRPVLGSNQRPLKSLTDMIKGKQGRFRENLLGKRVDYSARSVIAVGPELKLHQCGLPKKIALELFQPFIIRRLKELGYADTIKSAKKMLERKDDEVWDILEEVTQGHPVLLNRAPTLHRMGIQGFEPVLIEGNAILVHPLVCEGFNADFDGDQMAVHLPLSIEAQIEAQNLLLSVNNIFSPAHGQPIIAPSQDIVMGCNYLTISKKGMKGEEIRFSGIPEVFTAHGSGRIHGHAEIKVRMPEGMVVYEAPGKVQEPDEHGLYLTTSGRIIFNDLLGEGMPFYNYLLAKKDLKQVIHECFKILGRKATLTLLDDMKEIGFKAATRAGLSFSVDDLRLPTEKAKIIAATQKKVDAIEHLHQTGVLTDDERRGQIVDQWNHATQKVGESLMARLEQDFEPGNPYVNPIHVMVSSGARGSVTQIRQLAGMRGLMAKPSGEIIETPIKASFREGLKVLEYFSSTHGARKGLADTALKTADSGYLTRKLADVAQNVVVTQVDCGTLNGITKEDVYRGDKVDISLAQRITGRTSLTTVKDLKSGGVVVEANGLIDYETAKRVEELGYTKILLRSALTCEASLGVCAKCYGMDLSNGRLVEQGLAVGIVAAQSIGEPGTQLTMRTFHIGGVASKAIQESSVKAKSAGTVSLTGINTAINPKGEKVVLTHRGEVLILDKDDREVERNEIRLGAVLRVEEGNTVRKGTLLFEWDPHMTPILSEIGGTIDYEDIVEGATLNIELDPVSGKERRVIREHKGELHPQILVRDKSGGELLAVYPVPERAFVEVAPGDKIIAGTLLAKSPREITGTQDITGGLPRVTEIFEVRQPKNPNVIAEVDGVVEMGEKKRGKQIVNVVTEAGDIHEHVIAPGKHFRVHKGDRVKAGDPLVDGDFVPKDILRIKGLEVVQDYLLLEVQKVYRSQNVTINDKHIEIIISQMLRSVRVLDPGDADLLPETVIDKFRFRKINDKIEEQGKKPAQAEPLLQGITKASVQSESFISAASFQETTKVLTEAALSGKKDRLVGLKENVIMGHMIPAGTGFREYFDKGVKKLGQDPVATPVAAAPVKTDPLREFLIGGSEGPAPGSDEGEKAAAEEQAETGSEKPVAADDQELIGDTTVSEDAPEGVDEGVTGIDNREELIGGALPEEPSGEDAGNSASEGEKE